jgi:hypothetical protein
MTNNVYIAGSYKNRKAVKGLMEEIEKWGYHITFDWTIHTKDEDIGKYVQGDIEGIKDCDHFIYCMDGTRSRGKYFELGYAWALGKRIGIYLLPTFYQMTNDIYSPDTPPFDIIIENDSVFIKSRMYPILSNIDELKTWLSDAK